MSVEGDGRVRLFNVSDPQAPDGHTVYKVTLKVNWIPIKGAIGRRALFSIYVFRCSQSRPVCP